MRLPRRPVEALRRRWRAMIAPWAQLRALEARLEELATQRGDLPSRVDTLEAAVKEFEDADVLWKVEAMDDRLDDVEGQLSTLEDEMPNEDQMADMVTEAVAALAKRLRDALDDMG